MGQLDLSTTSLIDQSDYKNNQMTSKNNASKVLQNPSELRSWGGQGTLRGHLLTQRGFQVVILQILLPFWLPVWEPFGIQNRF